MPWSCQPCQREHNDDVTQCPECGETKQAWTFQVDKTRALRITGGRTKLQARRGLSAVPLAEEETVIVAAEWPRLVLCSDSGLAARPQKRGDVLNGTC